MIRAYNIPWPAGVTNPVEYFDFVSSLSIEFDDNDNKWLKIDPSTSYVEVNGTIPGLTEIQAVNDLTPVPQEVTMRQARLALFQANKLLAVDFAINQMTEPEQTTTRIWWEYATSVERNQPLVAALGSAIGLSSTDIDDLFRLAATL